MELLRDNIPTVSLSVSAAALYARAASSRLPPGLPRFAALLPVIAFYAALPLAFSSSILRFVAGFFLGWLSTFKLALLAAGRGPLDPALPVVPFLFTALFPVKLLERRPVPAAAAAEKKAAKTKTSSSSFLARAAEVAAFACILHLYQYVPTLPRYIRYSVYCLHMYFLLDLLIPCTAAAGRLLLGLELERQFDAPYLSTSLREFWGWRWNLMVSAVLRASVYDPARARGAPREAAALASFLVSGLMHEAMACYLLLRPPTGEMVAFFLLHCAFCVAEDACARRWRARGWAAAAAAPGVPGSRGVHGRHDVLALLPPRSAATGARRCCWRSGPPCRPSSSAPLRGCSGDTAVELEGGHHQETPVLDLLSEDPTDSAFSEPGDMLLRPDVLPWEYQPPEGWTSHWED